MTGRDFLTAELHHAARQLDRVRRLAAQMESQLAAQGLDEVAVYETLATSKAYRQLQRDQLVFQQMWLRVHRHLQRLPAPDPPRLPRIPLYLVHMAEPASDEPHDNPPQHQPMPCPHPPNTRTTLRTMPLPRAG